MGARHNKQGPEGRSMLRRVQPGFSTKEFAALRVLAGRRKTTNAALVREIVRAHLEHEGLLEPIPKEPRNA